MITKSKDYFLVQMLIASWIWVNKIGLEQSSMGPMGGETNLTPPKFWTQTFLYEDL